METVMPNRTGIENLTVIELARLSKVAPHVVRYYARIGLLSPRRDGNNGYKLFAQRDVARLRFIRKAKLLGYALGEIAKILDHANHGESPCALVRDIIEKRIDENRQKLDELLELQQRMEHALCDWRERPDRLPDGDMICHLIESVVD